MDMEFLPEDDMLMDVDDNLMSLADDVEYSDFWGDNLMNPVDDLATNGFDDFYSIENMDEKFFCADESSKYENDSLMDGDELTNLSENGVNCDTNETDIMEDLFDRYGDKLFTALNNVSDDYNDGIEVDRVEDTTLNVFSGNGFHETAVNENPIGDNNVTELMDKYACKLFDAIDDIVNDMDMQKTLTRVGYTMPNIYGGYDYYE